MKDELVKAGDFNVVIVDWAGGSLPLYTQATANTRLVGLEVAHFVNTLQVGGTVTWLQGVTKSCSSTLWKASTRETEPLFVL